MISETCPVDTPAPKHTVKRILKHLLSRLSAPYLEGKRSPGVLREYLVGSFVQILFRTGTREFAVRNPCKFNISHPVCRVDILYVRIQYHSNELPTPKSCAVRDL